MATALATLWTAVLLSARGGTSLPEFYVEQGWTQVGLFPDALRVGPDDLRDEHWFQLRLWTSSRPQPGDAAVPAAPPGRAR
jgi:hypothetical protein